MSIPEPSLVEHFATRAEVDGWDGITFTDSQNLCGDPFVAIGVAGRATDRLKFMTGVTNPATRHPAALATAAATAPGVTDGRLPPRHRRGGNAPEFTDGPLTLGIGGGDTALFHLGRKPMPVAEFFARTTELHTYLQR